MDELRKVLEGVIDNAETDRAEWIKELAVAVEEGSMSTANYYDGRATAAEEIIEQLRAALAAHQPTGYVVERADFSSSFEKWRTVAAFADFDDAREYTSRRVTINHRGAEVCRYRIREAGQPLPGSEGW